MPAKLKTQISENISVAVWQIAETEEFFFDFLKLLPEDEWRIKNGKLQKVRLQKLACRAALAELLGNNEIGITYAETGQPKLKDYYIGSRFKVQGSKDSGQPQLKNYCISFSHTKTSVVVALSKTPVGVDIEELTPRILPLYPRFMSEREIADCNIHNLKDLYYYWCAKEAMYKWYAKGNLDFMADLYVDKNEKKGIICENYEVQLLNFYFDNQIVVVCC